MPQLCAGIVTLFGWYLAGCAATVCRYCYTVPLNRSYNYKWHLLSSANIALSARHDVTCLRTSWPQREKPEPFATKAETTNKAQKLHVDLKVLTANDQRVYIF